MPRGKKYPDELKERSVRLVFESDRALRGRVDLIRRQQHHGPHRRSASRVDGERDGRGGRRGG